MGSTFRFASRLEPAVRALLDPYCRKHPRLHLAIGLLKGGETAVLHHVPGTPPFPPSKSPHQGIPPLRSGLPREPLYEIGSVTKTFTGALLARAIRDGLVRPDDPVTRFLPDLARNKSMAGHPVTLRQLATHTSGLPSLPPSFLARLLVSPNVRANPYAHFSEDAMLRFLAKYRFPARRRFRYSNMGAGLLGHILARVYGGDYETVLLDAVCRPLGLADTAIRLSGDQRARLVPGYDSRGRPASNWDFRALEGAGALRSTVRDLLAYLRIHIGGTGHPLEEALHDTHRIWHEEPGGRALGIAWFWERRLNLFWHNGGTGGYSSFVGFNKENGTGVVLLANVERHPAAGASLDGIGIGLMRLLGE
jgi:CubicO group peptidase (beta-lactamase class C family)